MAKKTTKKVNSDVKIRRIKWIKALLSGRYKQTRGRLCRQDDAGKESYCCLGVACKVMRFKKTIEITDNGIRVCFGDDVHQLDCEKMSKLNMSLEMQEDLVKMNDERKKSFKEIAKFLMKRWKITEKDLAGAIK